MIIKSSKLHEVNHKARQQFPLAVAFYFPTSTLGSLFSTTTSLDFPWELSIWE